MAHDTQTAEVEALAPERFPLANRFYKQCRFSAKCQRSDKVWVIRGEQRQVVAAVRLVPRGDDAWLLRSLCVAPTLRGGAIGSALLEGIRPFLEQVRCYCYPFAYLQRFYERAGFVELAAEDAPADIRGPWEKYNRQGRDLLIMAYSGQLTEGSHV